jgi:hypothetical protein
VLLTGQAESLSDHLRALEIARGVDGVQAVESQIQSPTAWRTGDLARFAGGGGGTATGIRSEANDVWITSAAKVRLRRRTSRRSTSTSTPATAW